MKKLIIALFVASFGLAVLPARTAADENDKIIKKNPACAALLALLKQGVPVPKIVINELCGPQPE